MTGQVVVSKLKMYDDIFCIRVTNRFTGQSKMMTKSEVDLVPVTLAEAAAKKPDEKRTRATKQLFDCEEVTEMYRVQNRLRTWLAKNTVPSSLGEAIYAVRKAGVGLIQAKIDEACAELETAKQAVREKYGELVEAQREGLGDLFNVNDYPPVDEFLGTFRIECRWIQIGVPPALEGVNSDMFQAEIRKQKQDIETAAENVRAILRGEFLVILESFRGMISGDQKTQFNAKTAKRLAEFRKAFDIRDLTNDARLREIMDSMAEVVEGLDAKTLRSDDDLRTAFQAATREVLSEAEEHLIEDAPRRRLRHNRQ